MYKLALILKQHLNWFKGQVLETETKEETLSML